MDRAEERLALIELLDRDGRCVRSWDVQQWPLTIGRALDNHLVLDDAFVAPHHATIDIDDQGSMRLRVGDTANGVALPGRKLVRGEDVELARTGTLMQLGGSRLRLRLRGETLAAERPLPAMLPHVDGRLLGTGAGVFLLALASHWLGLDPGADATAWLPLAIGVPVALAGWCGIWALMSKLFQHRFDFMGHLRIVLPWLLALELVDALLPQLAAGLGWPGLWRMSQPGQVLLLALMVRAHLAHMLPLHPRAVTATVAAVAIAAGAVSLTITQRRTDSFSRAPYMSTLPMPAFNWAGTVPPGTLVQDLAPLAERLAARVKKAKQAEEEDGTDGGESE